MVLGRAGAGGVERRAAFGLHLTEDVVQHPQGQGGLLEPRGRGDFLRGTFVSKRQCN